MNDWIEDIPLIADPSSRGALSMPCPVEKLRACEGWTGQIWAKGDKRRSLRFDGDLQVDQGMGIDMHFDVPHRLQPAILLSLACRQSRFGGVGSPHLHVISFDSATDERREPAKHAYGTGAFMQPQCERCHTQLSLHCILESA